MVTGPIPVGEPGNEANDFIQTMSGMDLEGYGYLERRHSLAVAQNIMRGVLGILP